MGKNIEVVDTQLLTNINTICCLANKKKPK